MLERTFGTKNPNETYIERIGAYGIIINSESQMAVVCTPSGYFLLGGGIEAGETHEECIKRECLEEAGLSVSVGDFICKGDGYFWSPNLKHYLHGIGYFYFAETLKQLDLQTEGGYKLAWLGIEDCCQNLFLEHQAWAVKQAVRLRNNVGKNKKEPYERRIVMK